MSDEQRFRDFLNTCSSTGSTKQKYWYFELYMVHVTWNVFCSAGGSEIYRFSVG